MSRVRGGALAAPSPPHGAQGSAPSEPSVTTPTSFAARLATLILVHPMGKTERAFERLGPGEQVTEHVLLPVGAIRLAAAGEGAGERAAGGGEA